MAAKPILAMVTDSVEPFQAGGKEARYAELARRLSGEFDVHVYTMKWWDGPALMDRDGVRFHAICPALPLYRGGRRSVVQALVFGLACLRLLGRRVSVVETDSLPYLHLFTLRLVCWLRGTRFVVTWHEIVGGRYLRSYLGLRGLAMYVAERLALRLPDVVVAASDHTAERIRRILGTGTDVVSAPNGVDLPAIEETPAGSLDVDIVTVGRLVEHKRIDLLLQVLAYLKRTHRPVTCRIIGTGPALKELHDQAQRLGLAGEVVFLTTVTDRSELFALMKASRLFVSTSEREGFGISALEALACRLPVVVTSAPGNLAQHVVDRAVRGTVCAPDLESIAAAVQEALDTSYLRDASAGSEQDWLSDYSWSTVADRVASVLRADGEFVR